MRRSETSDSSAGDDPFEKLLREAAHVPDRAVLAPGSVLGARYRLDHLLGEGGMGVVWAATHTVTGKRAALKLMAGAQHARPEMRRRFLREARAASQVDHPAIVRIHDVFELEHGELVMVMDLLEGETLRARLERDKRLSLSETARLLVPVASALAAAHASAVIHRDLKPENVFVTADPPETKLLDFGLAKLTTARDGSNFTRSGQPMGTPAYMAPEQVFGEQDVDRRADAWAFGALLYECLAGKRLVEESGLGQVGRALSEGRVLRFEALPDLPDDVRRLLEALLELDRGRRESDLSRACSVLGPYAGAELPLLERRDESVPAKVERGSRWALWLGAAALVVTASLAFVIRDREPASSEPATAEIAAPQTPPRSPVEATPPPGPTASATSVLPSPSAESAVEAIRSREAANRARRGTPDIAPARSVDSRAPAPERKRSSNPGPSGLIEQAPF